MKARCPCCFNRVRPFGVAGVRRIHYGVVVTLECPEGHQVVEHRKAVPTGESL